MTFNNGLSLISDLLNRYGLADLVPWARQMITEGRSVSEIELDLYNQQAFRTRFAGLFAREKAGMIAMSPAQYLEYENQAFQLARSAGLPEGFITRERVANLIGNDVSLSEYQARVNIAQTEAFNAPPQVRAELSRLYGVNAGDLTAYWLDPDIATPLLQQRFTAAQISGAAQRQGFGGLTAAEAEGLTTRVSPDEAEQAFGDLAQMGELFGALPGQQESAFTRESQLGLISGDAQSQQSLRRRQSSRTATFAGGGAFAEGREGISSLRDAGY